MARRIGRLQEKLTPPKNPRERMLAEVLALQKRAHARADQLPGYFLCAATADRVALGRGYALDDKHL
jgi:hypothetical protein